MTRTAFRSWWILLGSLAVNGNRLHAFVGSPLRAQRTVPCRSDDDAGSRDRSGGLGWVIRLELRSLVSVALGSVVRRIVRMAPCWLIAQSPCWA